MAGAVEVRDQQVIGTPASRIPSLDGLRGVAIALVLVWHGFFGQFVRSNILQKFWWIGSLSWSGVDLFFVLSGFLIGGILLDARQSPNYFSTFYCRRAFRILPLYAVLLLAYVILRPTVAGDWFALQVTSVPLAAFLTFTQNFWMAVPANFGGGAGITWSLAIEEQFYLLAPLVVRCLNRRGLLRVLITVVVGAPLLRLLILWKIKDGGIATYVLMPCRADALSIGVLCAIAMRSSIAGKVTRLGLPLTIALALPLLWLSWCRYTPFSWPMASFGYSLLALFYGGCLLLSVSHSASWLEWKPLRWLGSIAYGT